MSLTCRDTVISVSVCLVISDTIAGPSCLPWLRHRRSQPTLKPVQDRDIRPWTTAAQRRARQALRAGQSAPAPRCLTARRLVARGYSRTTVTTVKTLAEESPADVRGLSVPMLTCTATAPRWLAAHKGSPGGCRTNLSDRALTWENWCP